MLRIILSFITVIVVLSLLYLFYPVFVISEKPLLIINMCNEEELPRNFRMSIDALPEHGNSQPSLSGLKELQASGSAQFSEKSLEVLLNKLPSKEVTIVDLREESHGFINGTAVSWFVERDWMNKGKSLAEIQTDEQLRFEEIAKYPLVIAYASKKFPIPFLVQNTFVEEVLASKHELGYLRLPVTDHLKPSDQVVDLFIQFIKSLPKQSLWLHFHCAAGEGRTTTFLVMYDMMRNASKVKIQDIFLRQHLLGGIDFTQESTTNDWKKNYAEERKSFLRQFYVYCQQNPHFQKSWTTWLFEQKTRLKNNKSEIR